MTSIQEIDTPAALIDVPRMQRNIERMQERMNILSVRFRPHVKTAKCLPVAGAQREAGPAFTVGKLAWRRFLPVRSHRLGRRLRPQLYSGRTLMVLQPRSGRKIRLFSKEEPAMVATTNRIYRSALHPFHAVMLAGTFPLFLGAALSDYAYSTSYHIQWSTFASWLIAGGLVFAGITLVCAVIGLFRAHHRSILSWAYLLLLLVTWILGFINALIHARDAWAMMPTGLFLSIIVCVLTFAAVVIGFARPTAGGKA